MTTIDRALNRVVAEALEAGRCGCGGTCTACRRQAFEASGGVVGTPAGPITLPEWRGWRYAVSLHQLLRVANRVDLLMPRGRTPPATPTEVMLSKAWELAGGKSGGMPAALRRYFTRQPQVYRVGKAGGGLQAIDIGMTAGNLVGFRMLAHFVPAFRRSYVARSSGAGRNLRGRLGVSGDYKQGVNGVVQVPAGLGAIYVHLGSFQPSLLWGRRSDIRYLHVFESVLQRRELSKTYGEISGTRTFED